MSNRSQLMVNNYAITYHLFEVYYDYQSNCKYDLKCFEIYLEHNKLYTKMYGSIFVFIIIFRYYAIIYLSLHFKL